MNLHSFSFPRGARKRSKRVGRGRSSGHGKTCGRGQKGQNSRSGGGTRPGFEGGQMPLARRLPKRGFTNIFRKEYVPVNLGALEVFDAGTQVTPDLLREKGLVRRKNDRVKILANGELTRSLNVSAHAFSKSAAARIAELGGHAEVIKG